MLGAPSRREIPRAAARTSGTSICGAPLPYGTITDKAAATESSSPRTGAATDSVVSSIALSLMTNPSRRISESLCRSRVLLHTVCSVYWDNDPASTDSCSSRLAWASRTRPAADACSGSGPPTRETTGTASCPEIRSSTIDTRPSSTANCAC